MNLNSQSVQSPPYRKVYCSNQYIDSVLVYNLENVLKFTVFYLVSFHRCAHRDKRNSRLLLSQVATFLGGLRALVREL